MEVFFYYLFRSITYPLASGQEYNLVPYNEVIFLSDDGNRISFRNNTIL